MERAFHYHIIFVSLPQQSKVMDPSILSLHRRMPWEIIIEAPTTARYETREMIALLSTVFYVLFQCLSTLSQKERIRRRRGSEISVAQALLHEASFGVTADIDESETKMLVTWMDTHGRPDRIRLLGRLVWYYTFVAPQTSVSAVSTACTLLDFWLNNNQLYTEKQQIEVTAVKPNGLSPLAVQKIVAALSVCHMEHAPWPASVVDALLWAILQESNTQRTSLAVEWIRGHLILMGVLRPVDESECLQTTPLHSSELGHTLTKVLPRRDTFVLRLMDTFLPSPRTLHSPINPQSMHERTVALCLLPMLFHRLQEYELARRVLCDPFAAYCHIFCSENVAREAAELFMTSETNVLVGQEVLLLLHSQVLWKQRCCHELTGRDSVELVHAFKDIGVRLLSCQPDVGLLCINELLFLQTKQLVSMLQGITNALHYLALVLWSSGRLAHGKRKLPPHYVLSRRVFALERKLLESKHFEAQDFSDWYESVKAIPGETKSLDNVDIQYVHQRLVRAIDRFDAVRREISETDLLLQRG